MFAPTIKDPEDPGRIPHTRLARRILYGCWDEDLNTRVREQVGTQRRQAWGCVDLSANLLRAICDSLSVIYDRTPHLHHSEPSASPLIGPHGFLNRSGIWSLMQRVQRDTLGLRDMFVRVDVAADGELTYRPVYPDNVIAIPRPDKPDIPMRIEEIRPRVHPDTGEEIYTWDVLDISIPDFPVYVVLSQDKEEDLSEVFLGGDYTGIHYPYRKNDGAPILPYAVYHANNTGTLFDSYSNRELVEGTLNVGVLYTYLAHVIRSASWPQRWAVGCALDDLTEDGEGKGPSSIVVDPTRVIMFRPSEDGVQPSIGQWSTSANPTEIIETITRYERRLMTYAGLNGADLERVSGDPRSGYAVSVSREAQREVQRRFEPQFRKGDTALIVISAVLVNRAHNTNLPEDGYIIRYQSLPLSAQEQKAQVENTFALMEKGLITKKQAYMMIHEGITEEEADKALAEIQAQQEDMADAA